MSPGRFVLTFLLLGAAAAPAGAQEAPDFTVRLAIRPAAQPTPALKYRLLPQLGDRVPGNATTHYYRAMMLKGKEMPADSEAPFWKWMKMPLQDLPRKEVQAFFGPYRPALEQLELAARSTYCDWDVTERIRKHGISLLLPEVQPMREFAYLLRLKARLEMAEGQYDKAVTTMQTGLALARYTADSPTLISALVGIAIAYIVAADIDELTQQPGSPNLYWALTELPRPFIGLDRAFQGERLLSESLISGLGPIIREARTGRPLTPEQLQTAVKLLGGLLREGDVRDDWSMNLFLVLGATKVYPDAKRRLVERGMSAEQVEAMPVLQVALLDSLNEYERMFDELAKWQSLPYWEARAGMERTTAVLKQMKAKSADGVGIPLATLLLPAVEKVAFASARIDRKIAALRCVEALRLYAAAHDGKLPAALEDVKEVPVPIDPVTGKPFEYRLEGEKAVLSAPPPRGEPPHGGNSLRYELTVQKK